MTRLLIAWALLAVAVLATPMEAHAQAAKPNAIFIVADDLDNADQKYWPANRRFDHSYGNVISEVDDFAKDRGGVIHRQRDGEFLEKEGYYTNRIGDEAVMLMEVQDGKTPFFLDIASLAPPTPYSVPDAYAQPDKSSVPDPKRATYAGMITALHEQIGRIVESSEKEGLRDNTRNLFATHNGGLPHEKPTLPVR